MIKNGENKENKSFNITAQDGGFLYSFIITSVLLISIVFSAVLSVLSTQNESIFTSDLTIILGYFLSPIAILIAIGILRYKSKSNIVLTPFSKSFDVKSLIATIFIAFGLMFGLSNLNGLFVEFLKSINLTVSEPSLPSKSVINVILVIISVCVLPAVFEEIAFRGIILKGLSRTGVIFATLISGVLFSLFHMSPAQTVYQFIVGSVYSLIIIYGGNLIYVIAIHFINNLYVVLNYYFFNLSFSGTPLLILTILGSLSLAVGLFLLLKNRKEAKISSNEKKVNRLNFLLGAVLGAVASLVIWLQGLING